MKDRLLLMSKIWRGFNNPAVKHIAGSKTSIASFTILGIVIVLGLFAEKIAPYDPRAAVFEPFRPPSPTNIFGTDDLGRDIFSRVVYGARTSLLVGFSAAFIAILLGILVGMFSGYVGGIVDDILMRITESFQSVPRLVLAVVASALLSPSIINIILIIGGLSWPRTARVVRSMVLSIKELPFIEAAMALGASNSRIMFRHIMPSILPMAITIMGYEAAAAILIEAGLGFLGLSDPQMESWGRIIYDGQRYFMWGWWIAVIPGGILSATIIAINILADNVNSALSPRLRSSIDAG